MQRSQYKGERSSRWVTNYIIIIIFIRLKGVSLHLITMNLCKEISRNKTGSRQSVSSCSRLQSFWKTVHAKAVKLTHLIWLLFVIRHKKTFHFTSEILAMTMMMVMVMVMTRRWWWQWQWCWVWCWHLALAVAGMAWCTSSCQSRRGTDQQKHREERWGVGWLWGNRSLQLLLKSKRNNTHHSFLNTQRQTKVPEYRDTSDWSCSFYFVL